MDARLSRLSLPFRISKTAIHLIEEQSDEHSENDGEQRPRVQSNLAVPNIEEKSSESSH